MSFVRDVSPTVLWSLAGIFGLLVVASLVLWLLGRLRPGLDLGEVRTRVRSWWVMACVFALAMGVDRDISLVFFAFLSFLAFKEYLSLIPTRHADRSVLLLAYLAIPVQYLWIGIAWYGMFIIFIPVYMFLFLPLRMIQIGETAGFLRAVGTLHWGLMTTVFSISHVAFLLVLPPRAGAAVGGPALVLYLVVLTQLNDVAQFLWGKLLGRHKVVPKVSPGKTVEGLVGGVLTTLALAVVLAPWLTPFDPWHAVAAGLILGIGGFVGDVVISALKRDLGIKDSGTLLPGHGGILDRIDSLTYTAPLFFHFTWYYYY
ncbi:MAG TPA: phosphatidate cytidylyltransferase [Thermoanaerobaculia bacterium]|nr:phosphatidate cytidylyltransferase [Thermoanaerobaculia bacterium]